MASPSFTPEGPGRPACELSATCPGREIPLDTGVGPGVFHTSRGPDLGRERAPRLLYLLRGSQPVPGPQAGGPPFWSNCSETGQERLGPGREGRGWSPPGPGVSLSQLTWHRVLRRSAAHCPHPHASSGFRRPQASPDRARRCFCLNSHNHTFSHRPQRAVGCPEVGPRVQESPISTGTLETPILGKGPVTFLHTTCSLSAPCCHSCGRRKAVPRVTFLVRKADLVSALRARHASAPWPNLTGLAPCLSMEDKFPQPAQTLR